LAPSPDLIVEQADDALEMVTAADRIWAAFLDMEWTNSNQVLFAFVEKCKENVLFAADHFVVQVR
jgi:hypothetical protein